MKYQFIEQYKHEFPVVIMCQVLGVSESGFYSWRKRPACRRQREDAQHSQAQTASGADYQERTFSSGGS